MAANLTEEPVKRKKVRKTIKVPNREEKQVESSKYPFFRQINRPKVCIYCKYNEKTF